MHNLYPGGGGGNILLTYWDKRGSISNTCYLLLVSHRWHQIRAWHNCIKISLFPIATPTWTKHTKTVHLTPKPSQSSADQSNRTTVFRQNNFWVDEFLLLAQPKVWKSDFLLYFTWHILHLDWTGYTPENLDSKLPELSNLNFLQKSFFWIFWKQMDLISLIQIVCLKFLMGIFSWKMFSQKMFSPENVLHKFLGRPWSGERNGRADPNSRSVGATREWRSVASQYFSTNIDFMELFAHTLRIQTHVQGKNWRNKIEALIYCWYVGKMWCIMSHFKCIKSDT